MALINCNECKNKISEKAKVCPKCGEPNSKTQNIENQKNDSNDSNHTDNTLKYLGIAGVCFAIICFALWYTSPAQQCIRAGMPKFLCKM